MREVHIRTHTKNLQPHWDCTRLHNLLLFWRGNKCFSGTYIFFCTFLFSILFCCRRCLHFVCARVTVSSRFFFFPHTACCLWLKVNTLNWAYVRFHIFICTSTCPWNFQFLFCYGVFLFSRMVSIVCCRMHNIYILNRQRTMVKNKKNIYQRNTNGDWKISVKYWWMAYSCFISLCFLVVTRNSHASVILSLYTVVFSYMKYKIEFNVSAFCSRVCVWHSFLSSFVSNRIAWCQLFHCVFFRFCWFGLSLLPFSRLRFETRVRCCPPPIYIWKLVIFFSSHHKRRQCQEINLFVWFLFPPNRKHLLEFHI